MVCGSSYNYNKPGFMIGTSSMPFYGSSTDFSSCSSIFTQMFSGAVGGCNPFMTTYVQPNFNAMALWAVADNLLNVGTMWLGAAIQGRKDKNNSVENIIEDIELLKEKKADKDAELTKVDTELEKLNAKTDEIEADSVKATELYNNANSALSKMYDNYMNAVSDTKFANRDGIIKEYEDQEKKVKELKQKADDAKEALDEHNAKVAELEAKQKELQDEIGTLDSQIRTADEKADGQVLDKLLKRRKCSTPYSAVAGKFDPQSGKLAGDVSTADAWAVVNAYRNSLVADDQRKIYAKQFKAIYDALAPEDQGDFHGVYRVMRDNHSDIF